MPIHFNPDGRVTVDSVQEAIQFEQLRSKPTPKARPRKVRGRKAQGWDGFVSFLQGPENNTARKILALVQGAPDGIDRQRLARHLEAEIQVVTGTITGIGKKAAATGLERDEIITKDSAGSYRPGRLLVQHGAPRP